MKKFLTSLFFLCLLIGTIIVYKYNEEIRANVKDLLNIKPQQYYGVTVDMSQILPESDRYVTNSKGEDLIDLAKDLGINSFRITNIKSISEDDDSTTSSYSHEQWETVLDKMRKKGIHAVILVEGNAKDAKFHDLNLTNYYINFVKEYVVSPNLCSFSNVYAIDIRNEPLLNENNIEKMREASQLVKAACPNVKITIGSWRTDSGKKDDDGEPEYNWHDPREVKKLEDIVDIHSVHIYGFDKEKDDGYPDPYELTTEYLNEVKKYTDKPILIEEFGAANGDSESDQDTTGGIELQKAAYEGVLKATYDYKNRNVVGALSYLFHPRSSSPESWNILKDNGDTILPAAYTFKEYTKIYK